MIHRTHMDSWCCHDFTSFASFLFTYPSMCNLSHLRPPGLGPPAQPCPALRTASADAICTKPRLLGRWRTWPTADGPGQRGISERSWIDLKWVCKCWVKCWYVVSKDCRIIYKRRVTENDTSYPNWMPILFHMGMRGSRQELKYVALSILPPQLHIQEIEEWN